jgi:hypothetical protein
MSSKNNLIEEAKTKRKEKQTKILIPLISGVDPPNTLLRHLHSTTMERDI